MFFRQFVAFLLTTLALHAAATSTATFTTTKTPALRINEVITSSAGGDRIELFNAGATAVDLSGKVLQDQPSNPGGTPSRFIFPPGSSLAAGAYLVVFADNNTGTGFHTGFGLDAEGDAVLLFDSLSAASNNANAADAIEFGYQVTDFSLSRTGAAANVWALTTPTLGAANGNPVTLAAPGAIKINEWAGNIVFRLDHDMIELYNPAAQPVALGGVRLTDDVTRTGFRFPPLSFMSAAGFLPLYKGDYEFGLNGDRAVVTLLGENTEQIDQVTVIAQPDDRSQGRSPDGAANIVQFNVPSPGLSNTTPFPAEYQALLDNLRITEVMYDPAADNNASQFEFVELQNIGTAPLNLGGVRFTNGLEYTFDANTMLAPGAFIVVCTDRSSFRSRYPNVPDSVLAPRSFDGALSNDGDTIALTLPSPWRVHILRFKYEPTWFPSTSKGGRSLVPIAPATMPPKDWQVPPGDDPAKHWRASAAINGSPGVADPGTPTGGGVTARLSNLSVRAAMGAGQTLIVGFGVSGGNRSLLVRGVGPTLASLGVGGAMADPRIELYNNQTLVTQNDNWGNNPALSTAAASVGAFALANNSLDAAFQQDIDGSRTVQLKGTAAGVALVELYDLGSTNSPRLINVSARNQVGTGENILIFGFVINGTGTKRLLIRGVGPTLQSAFGLTGVLVDPRFEVVPSGTSTVVASNDNWDPSLASTFTSVGAFPLAAGSRDAAVVTSLAPGAYTVQVSGVNSGTGEALVEIYEVP